MANALQRQRVQATVAAAPARFTIGRDRGGRWIVQDRDGLVGGLFITESAALHFAAEESDHNPEQIHRAAEGVILKFALFTGGDAKVH
jgi:hypothetical protein